MVAEETLETRVARHATNAQLLWDGLEDLGLTLYVPCGHRLPVLTTVRVPEGVGEASVRRQLPEEYAIEIGGGIGGLKGKVWRIGLTGHSSRKEKVALLLAALQTLLR